MALSSTQIGAIAENLVANELMIESEGRLSSFRTVADDDGVDVLVLDKVSGRVVALQVKCRTKTLRRGNSVHFEVRKSTLKAKRDGMLLCVLLEPSLRRTERAWLFPVGAIPKLAADRGTKFVLRPNKGTTTKDKYRAHQCEAMDEVVRRLIQRLTIGEK